MNIYPTGFPFFKTYIFITLRVFVWIDQNFPDPSKAHVILVLGYFLRSLDQLFDTIV